MTERLLVNGSPSTPVSALDRGLAYGDGLFETIRFVRGAAPLWSRHMARLHEGCQRLRLPLSDAEMLLREAGAVIDGLEHAVVRVTLTRGLGERGYAPSPTPTPTRIVAGFEAPAMSGDAYANGLRVRWCDTRLAAQPLLAGLKHLNRLEQVLARAEWSDPAIGEGLLCDSDGQVISGSMTNLFAMLDGVLVTPALNRCGVAGVARAEILASQAEAQVRAVSASELAQASEIFLCSSVRGILPVQALGDTVYVPGPVTRVLQQHWRGLGFEMEQA